MYLIDNNSNVQVQVSWIQSNIRNIGLLMVCAQFEEHQNVVKTIQKYKYNEQHHVN